MTLSFKNVGVRKDEQQNDPVNTGVTRIPFGIKTPIELSHGTDDLFVMHYVVQDQVRDNLKNLVLTNHGERLAQYKFGANLRPLCSEYANKEAFDSEAMININTAIKAFMPYIVPLEFKSAVERDNQQTGLARISISVIYSIPKLRVQRDQIDVFMVLM